MTVINKKNAPHYHWGEICEAWKLLNGKSMSIMQERMPPCSSETRHYHVHASQFFFMLEGVAVMEADGVDYVLQKHEGIEISSGVAHCIRNISSEDAEFLVISQPGTKDDRIVLKKVKTISAVTL
ncbi:cupin domain-containing protein [Fictibacillus iocasae]|uniref:Cupin domain-containing protein n=1 Tax=Fictibacillus iocasae TaxID=2715437 RepID=A0ABW2NQ61_9BACL